jgi:hypothetical protein
MGCSPSKRRETYPRGKDGSCGDAGDNEQYRELHGGKMAVGSGMAR